MPKVALSQQLPRLHPGFATLVAPFAAKSPQKPCQETAPSQPIHWISSRGEILQVTYSKAEKRVHVSVLKNGEPFRIGPEYLPRELKSVKSVQHLLAIFTHSYVRTVQLSDGGYRLCVSGRLLGGQPYRVALTDFKRYIEELANPFLANEIRTRLQERCQSTYRLSDGLDGWFESPTRLSLPRDFKALITGLSEAIKGRVRELKDESEFESLTEELNTAFCSIATASDQAFWPELRTLLLIQDIKTLENSQTARILREVQKDRANIEQLRELVVGTWLSPEAVHNIDEHLQSVDEELDLNTLLSDIILKKPAVSTSIIDYWGKELSFFEHKTIYLKDPVSHKQRSWAILKAERTGTGAFVFQMEDGCKIGISTSCQISLQETIRYDLLKSIIDGLIQLGEGFLLEAREDHETSISPGRYILTNRKYHDRSLVSDLIATSYYEIELSDEQNVPHYTFYVYYGKPSKDSRFRWDRVAKIEVYSQKNRKIVHEPSSFKRYYQAVKAVEKGKDFSNINRSTARQCILIKDEGASDRVRLARLAILEEAVSTLIQELVVNDAGRLSALVDNWIERQLQSIDLQLVEGSLLGQRIQEIAKQYKEELEVDKSPETLLLQIVREANYSSKISKDRSVLIARTMGLLNKAFEHANKLSGKDAVIVIGNTGSGKSTSICYLLKAKLERVANKVGDVGYEVKTPDPSLPKIGQKIGTSETLYSQGYPIPGSPTTIVDCAGFDDTRGGDYELCANLSIDLVEQKLNKIQAVLVVIPFQSFILDRGNPVINLAHNIEERFPKIFDSKSSDFQRLFVLVTKQEQVSNDVRASFPQRLETLCSEERANICRLRDQDADARDLGQNYSRLKIWESLDRMNREGRILLLDPLHLRQRGALLRQCPIAGGPGAGKMQYVQAMDSEEMQKKFGATVVLSAHTWTEVIFKEYLENYPNAISRIETDIVEQEQSKTGVAASIEAKNQQVAELDSQVLRLESIVQQLRQGGDVAIDVEIKEEIDRVTKVASHSLQALLDEASCMVEQKEAEQIRLLREIDQIKGDIAAKHEQIAKIEQEIGRMSVGIRTQELWKMKYEPDAEIRLRTYKLGARQKAIDEIEEAREEDFEAGSRKVIAKEYRGRMVHDPVISKRYRLVAKNSYDSAWKRAMTFISRLWTKKTDGAYQAKISGRGYQLDATRSTPEGTKIKYAFTTTWDGEPLPEIKIVHKVPNLEYYEELIINRQKDKSLACEQITELNLRIDGSAAAEGKLRAVAKVEQEIADLGTRVAAHRQQLAEERANISITYLENLALRQKGESIALSQQIELLGASVPGIDRQIMAAQAQLEEKKADKRRFAAAIYGQLDNATVLRAFALLIVSKGDSEEELQSEVIKFCRRFLTVYDAKFTQLVQECERDLALEMGSSLSSASTYQSSSSSSSSADRTATFSSSSSSSSFSSTQ